MYASLEEATEEGYDVRLNVKRVSRALEGDFLFVTCVVYEKLAEVG